MIRWRFEVGKDGSRVTSLVMDVGTRLIKIQGSYSCNMSWLFNPTSWNTISNMTCNMYIQVEVNNTLTSELFGAWVFWNQTKNICQAPKAGMWLCSFCTKITIVEEGPGIDETLVEPVAKEKSCLTKFRVSLPDSIVWFFCMFVRSASLFLLASTSYFSMNQLKRIRADMVLKVVAHKPVIPS